MSDTSQNATSENTTSQGFQKLGFAKTFVLPALLVFLVPVLALLFFLHAQSRFDDQMRQGILAQIRNDERLSAEERQEAIRFFSNVPVSRLMENEEFARGVDGDTRFHYATFRWMIRISAWSILSGVAVFLLAGVCVLASLQSRFVQYLSLLTGWHVLRIYGALQVAAQGVLLTALSFWVTALWLGFYSVKLVFVIGALAVFGVFAVIRAIFRRPDTSFVVAGQVIENTAAMPLWDELRGICAKVGTEPPDQVIAGIDDNFFVTEHPVTVDGKTYHGRTLFVSLALLKHLDGSEADAVLAHEMAHFSGGDTLYSRRISPLLSRYGHYLQGLHEGGITLPVFYYVLCFRALFELSLGRHNRRREFRADSIATETTSPRDFAGGLLRIVAYSHYRESIEQDLFSQERALEAANVSERIEQGFPKFTVEFAEKSDIGAMEVEHPFDSHPPLSQRLDAVGVPLASEETRSLITDPGDGRWYEHIDGAEETEREQWAEFEERFREFHEQTLPYRFLPETDEEEAVVVKAFPEVTLEGKDVSLVFDHEKLHHSDWPEPVYFRDIGSCSVEDALLVVNFANENDSGRRNVKLKKFAKNQQELLETLNRYYGRYLAAVEYQGQKAALAESATEEASAEA